MTDKFRSRPNISGKKLDFSGFHPLDHNLLECHGYPGGRRTHVSYRWDFQWKGEIRAATLCKIGRHTPGQWWSRTSTWKGCIDCGKKLSEPQPE